MNIIHIPQRGWLCTEYHANVATNATWEITFQWFITRLCKKHLRQLQRQIEKALAKKDKK